MLGILGSIGTFFVKMGVGTIVQKLIQANVDKKNAETEEQRIAADIKIAQLEARAAVLAQDPVAPWIRLGFALPVVWINAKLFIWDKILGWGVTDALSQEMNWVMITIIGFYFLSETTARIFKK